MTDADLECPKLAQQAALDGIKKRATTRGFWTPNLRKAKPDTLQLSLPHRIALLSLAAILSGASLRATAQSLGWRFFVSEAASPKEPIAAAHVALAHGGDYRLTELNEGPFVSGAMKAFQLADSKEQSSTGAEAAERLLLLAPAAYFVGLWLRYDQQDADWVLPIDPTLNGLDVDRIKPAALLPKLREAVTKAATDPRR